MGGRWLNQVIGPLLGQHLVAEVRFSQDVDLQGFGPRLNGILYHVVIAPVAAAALEFVLDRRAIEDSALFGLESPLAPLNLLLLLLDGIKLALPATEVVAGESPWRG